MTKFTIDKCGMEIKILNEDFIEVSKYKLIRIDPQYGEIYRSISTSIRFLSTMEHN
jgi:hypothetical protein